MSLRFDPTAGRDRLGGIVSVLLASFDPQSEALLVEDIDRQMAFLRAAGVRGVAVPMFGTEGYKLSGDEREALVERAVSGADGEMTVVGNVLAAGAREAASCAARYVELGVDVVSVPLPRATGCDQGSLFDFARRVCESVDRPVMVQDWNPGGPTLDERFCSELKARCANFAYVKLEEPLSVGKIRRIVTETGGEVQCLDGWGALRAIQALDAGAIGLMPGPAMADALVRVFDLHAEGRWNEAADQHEALLGQMVCALQGSLEFFLVMEKYLAWKRGLIRSRTPREPSLRLDAGMFQFGERMCDRLLARLPVVSLE